MNIIVILVILFYHWFADAVMQTNEMATNKSKSWEALLLHTVLYSYLWIIPGIVYALFNIGDYVQFTITYFVLITFVCHTITDYFTSRINKKLLPERETLSFLLNKEAGEEKFISFPKGENYHNFFVMVLLDQFLHFAQLFLTFYFLTK